MSTFTFAFNPQTDKFYDAIVVRRTVEPSGTPLSVDPLTEKYDAVAVNTMDTVRVTARLPERRISNGARIIPANVGDPCKITIINGKAMLFVYEGIPFVNACQ